MGHEDPFRRLEADMAQVVGLIDPPPLTVPLEIDPREGQCRIVRKVAGIECPSDLHGIGRWHVLLASDAPAPAA
jgi:hypothetical protein